jgi:serine protein kinase
MSEDFHRIIQEDRETRKRTMWKGSMMEYLEIVRETPEIAKLAHKRMFRQVSPK